MKRLSLVLFSSSILCCIGLVLVLSLVKNSAASTLPDLSDFGAIHAVTRENGSGTRAQLDKLLDTDEAVNDYSEPSTNEVIAEVVRDRQAVGYAAMSSLYENTSVKTLMIDGVAPTKENFRNRTYPLTRNYYVAWRGPLGEVGRDFVRYVMTAGQGIIAEETNAITASSPFTSLMPSGTLTINGSTSIEPLMGKLIEDYMNYNPNASVTLDATDSSTGLKEAMNGKCNLAITSRDLTADEKDVLSYRMIAIDGIAILVNDANPLTNLTAAQVHSIYSGEAQDWKDLDAIQ